MKKKKIEDKKVFVSVGVEDPEKMIEDFWNALYGRSKVSQNIYQIKMLKLLILKIKRALKFMYQKRLIEETDICR
ncbi:hypothetical protein ACVNPZ_02875 [Staphylococcus aureus]